MTEEVIHYLAERCISKELIHEFGKGNIIQKTTYKSYEMNLKDLEGTYHGNIIRYIDGTTPKEKCTKGAKPSKGMLYSELPDWDLIRHIIVCEGSPDFLSAHTLRGDREDLFIVGIVGSSNLRKHLGALQGKCDSVLILMDTTKDVDIEIQKVVNLDCNLFGLGGIYDARYLLNENLCKDLNEALKQGVSLPFDEIIKNSIGLKELIIKGNLSPSKETYCVTSNTSKSSTRKLSDVYIANYLYKLHGLAWIDGACRRYSFETQERISADRSHLTKLALDFLENISYYLPGNSKTLANNIADIIITKKLVELSSTYDNRDLYLQDGIYNAKKKKLSVYHFNKLARNKFDYHHKNKPDPELIKKGLTAITFNNLLKKYFKSYTDKDRREVTEFMLTRFSNCLVPTVFNTKCLCFYGGSRNGKGTLAKIIRGVLGEGNTSTVPMSVLQKNETKRFHLCKSRLNIDLDMDQKAKLNDGEMKAMMVHEETEFRKLYKDSNFMIMRCEYLMLCNQIPNDYDKNRAVRERMIIVPFLETFTGKEQRTHIDKKILDSEREDIFWLLVHYLEIHAQKPEHLLNFDIPQCLLNREYEPLVEAKPENIYHHTLKKFVAFQCAIDITLVNQDKEKIMLAFKKYCAENGVTEKSDTELSDRFYKNLATISHAITQGERTKLSRNSINGIRLLY